MNRNTFIGNKVISIRQSKNISLEEVAERTGLSVEQLESIEQDKHFPSLAPLIKIARALGCRLGTFLDDQDELGAIITRKNERQTGISFSHDNANAQRHMEYYSLSGAKSGRHMEPFIIDIGPTKEGANFILSTHEGEEFIYCLEGVIEINYGKQSYILEEGDSIYYDSIVAHHVHAADENNAKILAVVYTPA